MASSVNPTGSSSRALADTSNAILPEGTKDNPIVLDDSDDKVQEGFQFFGDARTPGRRLPNLPTLEPQVMLHPFAPQELIELLQTKVSRRRYAQPHRRRSRTSMPPPAHARQLGRREAPIPSTGKRSPRYGSAITPFLAVRWLVRWGGRSTFSTDPAPFPRPGTPFPHAVVAHPGLLTASALGDQPSAGPVAAEGEPTNAARAMPGVQASPEDANGNGLTLAELNTRHFVRPNHRSDDLVQSNRETLGEASRQDANTQDLALGGATIFVDESINKLRDEKSAQQQKQEVEKEGESENQ
ncbi:unnamed protein product [Clonostachys rosea]|uniref:Uncharacterized protein n=1 Tax=Bionectria ochroleuca TaxID=29856 RepID=A0ABY6V3I6_BIOOC|nr:unnamed protein product [Clonostachys rosea]